MIDWKNCKPEDFSVAYITEEVLETGDRVVFPVDVYHGADEFVFRKSVPIMSSYYFELRKTQGWKEHLLKVLKARVKDEIVQRINTGRVDIQDKIDLFSESKEGL